MAGRYVGFGKKLFDLALGKGKSNVSTAIVGVEPNIGSLKEFSKHKDKIIKSTDKYTKGLTEEGKIKVKKNVAPTLSKLSKITKKKPVEKAKGGRVGLKRGTGLMKKSNVQKIKETFGPRQSKAKKKKFPDLTGDGKVTFADILKGRGVINGKKNKTVI